MVTRDQLFQPELDLVDLLILFEFHVSYFVFFFQVVQHQALVRVGYDMVMGVKLACT